MRSSDQKGSVLLQVPAKLALFRMCEINAMLAVERVVPVQISLDTLEYHTHA